MVDNANIGPTKYRNNGTNCLESNSKYNKGVLSRLQRVSRNQSAQRNDWAEIKLCTLFECLCVCQISSRVPYMV